jgi:RNA polymerase sigma-70 factor (ECF subfamily)
MHIHRSDARPWPGNRRSPGGQTDPPADALCSSTQIQFRLDRLRAGDTAARDELLEVAYGRLTRLARKMLRGYPSVRQWEQTDDVAQNAALRLWRSLGEVRPTSVLGFIRVASTQIRRELIDLARHYDGRDAPGRHHAVRDGSDGSGGLPDPPDPGTDTDDPARLAAWTDFHEHVEALPDEEKEVFDLLWYQGLPQAEAAALLGVTERVVRYRWRAARLRLHERLGGRFPR